MIVNYTYSTISSEISANRPVMAYTYTNHPSAQLHTRTFVMDGVNNQLVTENLVRYCPWEAPTIISSTSYYEEYVRCNLGWNGGSVAFYHSFLFSIVPNSTLILKNIKGTSKNPFFFCTLFRGVHFAWS